MPPVRDDSADTELSADRHDYSGSKEEQRLYLSGNADLCNGAVCFLCSYYGCPERGEIPEMWESGSVSGESHQSDSGARFHVFPGNSHADPVWRHTGCPVPSADDSSDGSMGEHPDSWHGCFYDCSDDGQASCRYKRGSVLSGTIKSVEESYGKYPCGGR